MQIGIIPASGMACLAGGLRPRWRHGDMGKKVQMNEEGSLPN